MSMLRGANSYRSFVISHLRIASRGGRDTHAFPPVASASRNVSVISLLRRMLMNAKMLWGVSKGAFHEFVEDKVMRLSAALAYYALFSMAPLVIIVISIAGIFFGQQAVTGQMHGQLADFFGDQGAQTIESMMSAARKPSSSIIASIIGIVTLLIGATGVFGQLQDALN